MLITDIECTGREWTTDSTWLSPGVLTNQPARGKDDIIWCNVLVFGPCVDCGINFRIQGSLCDSTGKLTFWNKLLIYLCICSRIRCVISGHRQNAWQRERERTGPLPYLSVISDRIVAMFNSFPCTNLSFVGKTEGSWSSSYQVCRWYTQWPFSCLESFPGNDCTYYVSYVLLYSHLFSQVINFRGFRDVEKKKKIARSIKAIFSLNFEPLSA